MSEKPAKTRRAAKSVAAAPPATAEEKPTASRTRAPRRRRPSHHDIAQRAYFIHLEEGVGDELENWLRAERELKAA